MLEFLFTNLYKLYLTENIIPKYREFVETINVGMIEFSDVINS